MQMHLNQNYVSDKSTQLFNNVLTLLKDILDFIR